MDNRESHIEQVRAWLSEHVIRLPDSTNVQLSNVKIDWSAYPKKLNGIIELTADSRPLKPFSFFIDAAGKVQLVPPMFTSPLGAPASYSQYEFEGGFPEHIAKKVQNLLPPIRGIGWDDPPNALISARFPDGYDLTAWEQRNNRPTPVSSPDAAIHADAAHAARSRRATHLKEAGKSGLSVLHLPILLVGGVAILIQTIIIFPILVLFGAFSQVDKGARQLGGQRYEAARDKSVEIIARLLAWAFVAVAIFLTAAYCVESSDRGADCDWDRSGQTCTPG